MKATLAPLYFESAQDPDFINQINALRSLLADEAEILEATPLGSELPEADAVVFPQMLGSAYRRLNDTRAIGLPILVRTSEFGTVSMWDWEINSFLNSSPATAQPSPGAGWRTARTPSLPPRSRPRPAIPGR